jgi:hypothetical protein
MGFFSKISYVVAMSFAILSAFPVADPYNTNKGNGMVVLGVIVLCILLMVNCRHQVYRRALISLFCDGSFSLSGIMAVIVK